jgi:hypothetical protein
LCQDNFLLGDCYTPAGGSTSDGKLMQLIFLVAHAKFNFNLRK